MEASPSDFRIVTTRATSDASRFPPQDIKAMKMAQRSKTTMEGERKISTALFAFASCLKEIGESTTNAATKKIMQDTSSIVSSDDDSSSNIGNTEIGRSFSEFKTMGRKGVNERLLRSRERNRVHARKTRQRKKEQMQVLTNRADDLKSEQIRLKQIINEKNTASILVGLFASSGISSAQQVEDPRVEALLRRPTEEIPEAAKLPELPALILPGQHNAKKQQDPSAIASKEDLPDDGIDYGLLGKDRSKCTPVELDQIRRERNRMHAKRTRDRKRLFMDEMAEMCKKLQEENDILQDHLDGLNGCPSKRREFRGSVVSPCLSSTNPELAPAELTMPSRSGTTNGAKNLSQTNTSSSENGVTFDQIKTLLEAASTFSSSFSDSTNSSLGGSLSDNAEGHSSKRRRLDPSATKPAAHVPESITTLHMSAVVGC